MQLRSFPTSQARRLALEKTAKIRLRAIGSAALTEDAFRGHCENPIGATQMPLGVAGPLQIKNQSFDFAQNKKSKIKNYFIPLSTTEGALVASISRGCKAITQSGGATTYAYRMGATRGPVFLTDSIEGNRKFYNWIKENEKKLISLASSTSKHLQLTRTMVKTVGRYSFVRFSFDTEDAMGMNMVTIATERLVNYIEEKTKNKCLSLAGNFDIDKKAAWLNFIENRGFKAWAEVVLSRQTLETILKTTAEQMFQTWLSKCIYGSIMSGSLGFNAQFANVIAAIFIATGQDPAHVVEGSLGVTTTEILPSNDLYISIYLPALMVGTVGGGTNLPTQKEALSLLGVSGEGKAEEFAEVVAAAVLAGEISLLASLAEGSLAKTHERFRKNL